MGGHLYVAVGGGFSSRQLPICSSEASLRPDRIPFQHRPGAMAIATSAGFLIRQDSFCCSWALEEGHVNAGPNRNGNDSKRDCTASTFRVIGIANSRLKAPQFCPLNDPGFRGMLGQIRSGPLGGTDHSLDWLN